MLSGIREGILHAVGLGHGEVNVIATYSLLMALLQYGIEARRLDETKKAGAGDVADLESKLQEAAS